MEPFKVICKGSGQWEITPRKSKIVNYTKFFGLFKYSKIVLDDAVRTHGPSKDEICIVINEYIGSDSGKYYELSGYPYGGYDARLFIRLDEFTETQKEIATKAEPVLN